MNRFNSPTRTELLTHNQVDLDAHRLKDCCRKMAYFFPDKIDGKLAMTFIISPSAGWLAQPNLLRTSTAGPTSPACCSSSNLSVPVCLITNVSEKTRFETRPGFSQGKPDAKVGLNYWCTPSLRWMVTWVIQGRIWRRKTTSRFHATIFGGLFGVERQKFISDRWKCAYLLNLIWFLAAEVIFHCIVRRNLCTLWASYSSGWWIFKLTSV